MLPAHFLVILLQQHLREENCQTSEIYDEEDDAANKELMSRRIKKAQLTHYDSIEYTTLASDTIVIIDNLRNSIIAFGFDSSRQAGDVAWNRQLAILHPVIGIQPSPIASNNQPLVGTFCLAGTSFD
jgi:hypothetical protein